MEKKNRNKKRYFIILILILFIFIAITIVCIISLPKEIAKANNAKRKQGIILIMNALHKYESTHRGQLPTNIIPNKIIEISTNGANICSSLVPNYISSIPIDPTIKDTTNGIINCNSNYTSEYYILISKDLKQIKIVAKQAELNEQISLSD
jgi:hypothetical protein